MNPSIFDRPVIWLRKRPEAFDYELSYRDNNPSPGPLPLSFTK